MSKLELNLPEGLSRIQHHLYMKIISYCNQVNISGEHLKRILDEWNLPLPNNFESYDNLANAFGCNYDQVSFLTPSECYKFVVKEGRTLTNSIIPISINQAFRLFLQSKWMMDFDLDDFDESTYKEFFDCTSRVVAASDQISKLLIQVTSKYEQVESDFVKLLQICQPIKDYFIEMLAPIIAQIIKLHETDSLQYSAECIRPQLIYIRAHIYKLIFICLLFDNSSLIL